VPCEVAAAVARGNGTRLTGCEANGLVLSVTVSWSFAGIPITAAARAGPGR
jgi:hypothetical protein